MKLAIKWNQIERVKTYINPQDTEKLSKKQLFNIMELAIIENRFDFVELLIDRSIEWVTEFLTKKRLLFFYNCTKVLNFFFFF